MAAKTQSRWSLPVSLAFTAVAIPLMFWMQFGVVDGYAYGFTGFLLLLQLAVGVIPKKVDELAESSEASKVKRRPFDFLGVIWLLCIPFAPFLGWIVTSSFDLDPSNWKMLFGIRAFLCVVLPVICVLPLIRYVRGKPAPFLIAVLGIGTAFPILTGLDSAIDFVHGAEWQKVEIVGAGGFTLRPIAAGVDVSDLYIKLGDGRTLARSKAATNIHGGAIELLVLPASEIILGARG